LSAVTENTAFQTTILVCLAHSRFFTTMRYINRHFTYLLTYLRSYPTCLQCSICCAAKRSLADDMAEVYNTPFTASSIFRKCKVLAFEKRRGRHIGECSVFFPSHSKPFTCFFSHFHGTRIVLNIPVRFHGTHGYTIRSTTLDVSHRNAM